MIFALLISAGLNAGILATLWVTRAKTPPPPRPVEAQGPPSVGRPGDPPPPREPHEAPTGSPVGAPLPSEPSPRERGHPGPGGPPDEGPFGGETAEVGPEPGRVLSVPSTPPPRLREFADRLGVTGEKRERFFALQLKMIAAMRDGRWRVQQLRREVRIEMFSDRPDRTQIEANLAAIQTAQLALERQTVHTILDTREILDGEAERQYLEFITRLRLGAGESKPDGPRPQGGFGRARPFPRGQRRLTPEERLERRRRFEEWQARPGTGQTVPPPQRSEPKGEAPPPGS